MINKLTEKIKVQKIIVKENSGIHGVCPDCGSFLDYDKIKKEYNCLGTNCCFTADKYGNRIWDNEMRDKKSNKNKVKRQIQKEINDYLTRNDL